LGIRHSLVIGNWAFFEVLRPAPYRFEARDTSCQPDTAHGIAAKHVAEIVCSEKNATETDGQHQHRQSGHGDDAPACAGQHQYQNVSEKAISDQRTHRMAAGKALGCLVDEPVPKRRPLPLEELFQAHIQQPAGRGSDQPDKREEQAAAQDQEQGDENSKTGQCAYGAKLGDGDDHPADAGRGLAIFLQTQSQRLVEWNQVLAPRHAVGQYGKDNEQGKAGQQSSR
jgi:hypothetical protein